MITERHKALFNKGVDLLIKEEYDKALKILLPLKHKARFKEIFLNLGIIYREKNEFKKAWECFETAASLDIPYCNGKMLSDPCPIALGNLAALLYDTGEDDTLAREYWLASYTLDKEITSSAWNFGLTGIRQYCDGFADIDLKKMWEYYSFRFHKINVHALNIHELWNIGEEHKEDDIVVLADQGMGDTIMFARYLPFVEKYFRKVYVQTEAPLKCMFDNIYDADCNAKYYIPIGSLGGLLDYIPEGEWLASRRIDKVSDEFAIGCVWQGAVKFQHDKWRSCDPIFFDSLDVKKYTFGPNPTRSGYTHLPGYSFTDTLENLSLVDLVVTVDTSMAHFCGALGKPCLVLMPLHFADFRWGSKKSLDKNVWYPSVRVIRNAGDWSVVFKEVGEIIGRSRNS